MLFQDEKLWNNIMKIKIKGKIVLLGGDDGEVGSVGSLKMWL
jgi:hypothetical protein